MRLRRDSALSRSAQSTVYNESEMACWPEKQGNIPLRQFDTTVLEHDSFSLAIPKIKQPTRKRERERKGKGREKDRERERKREENKNNRATLPMKLIGDGADGRKVLVGVKLDPCSRELLTWALVKVAESGDLVIALHVLDSITGFSLSISLSISNAIFVLNLNRDFCCCRGNGIAVISRENFRLRSRRL